MNKNKPYLDAAKAFFIKCTNNRSNYTTERQLRTYWLWSELPFDKTIYYLHLYLKNSFSKSIVHVIKHVKFQLYRTHPDGITRKKLTTDDKYIYRPVWLFIYQTMFLSGIEKKNCEFVSKVYTSAKWVFKYLFTKLRKIKCCW